MSTNSIKRKQSNNDLIILTRTVRVAKVSYYHTHEHCSLYLVNPIYTILKNPKHTNIYPLLKTVHNKLNIYSSFNNVC